MIKKLISGIEISQGGIIPRGYGVSYYLPDRDIGVCYPLLLNKVVRWVRNAYYWVYLKISRIRKLSMVERISFESYRNGYAEGFEKAHHRNANIKKEYRRGHTDGWNEAFAVLDKALAGENK